MAEITKEVICEVLEGMPARLGNIEQGQKEVTTRISALQTHMLAVEKDVANLYEALAALDTRIERIEKRLDIVGEPEL